VADVERATAFYRALGWQPSSASVPGRVTFFGLEGAILSLWSRDDLAAEGNVDRGVPGANSLAVNLESRTEVDAAFERIREAGGRITAPPVETDWGGYSGYFADPDGHLWEVAHNPFWPIGPDGRPTLP
jgi:predicted lactoylglutathione lyase